MSERIIALGRTHTASNIYDFTHRARPRKGAYGRNLWYVTLLLVTTYLTLFVTSFIRGCGYLRRHCP